MSKTYTSMDLIDGKFVATVYDSTNNQEIYKTNPHRTQLLATQEVNLFLTSSISNTKQTTITNITKLSNNAKNTSTPVQPLNRRCCGR